MRWPQLRLEEKVAQLFMLGSDSTDLTQEIEPFYRYGLGGLLLFRHHLQPFETAMDLRDFLSDQTHRFQGGPPPFVGIDQEGGQVERLPHWLFPTGIMPVVFGLKQDVHFCEQVHREVARRLRWLGFTLNFAPTVDLNKEVMNPIIGVRAFGSQANEVLPFARIVMKTHLEAGVLPVAKHFPGHGSGTIDSHLALPTFDHWSEEELAPYEALIQDQLSAVLAAHGLYPQLAKLLGADPKIPASLSQPMLTQLLRSKLKFKGLIFTDDLMMGAVWGDSDPLEVALMALEAGADILVYRRALPEALYAFEALVSRVQQGKFSEALLDEKLERILNTKAFLAQVPVYDYPEVTVSNEACAALALQWAEAAFIEFHHQFISPLPFSTQSQWALVAPDRNTMRHYQPDAIKGRDLLGWCQYYGVSPKAHHLYPVTGDTPFIEEAWPQVPLDTLVFVAFNSHLHPEQVAYYEKLKSQHPQAKMILASCGMPTDRDVLSRPWIHVQLPSFRPAAMQAFVQWLITSPKSTASA